jgi:hypothetical protein
MTATGMAMLVSLDQRGRGAAEWEKETHHSVDEPGAVNLNLIADVHHGVALLHQLGHLCTRAPGPDKAAVVCCARGVCWNKSRQGRGRLR